MASMPPIQSHPFPSVATVFLLFLFFKVLKSRLNGFFPVSLSV